MSSDGTHISPHTVGMCFGTFDLFHPGHEYYLREAARQVDRLIIVIARESRVLSGKGRVPIHSEEERLSKVRSAFPSALVILGDEHDIFAPLRAHHPDILFFGYDQRAPLDTLSALFPQTRIIRIGGHETSTYKSSLLRALHHPGK